jgi:hypothetical protein
VLVLVSFVLVLAAAVTLVIGLLQTGLTLIWLSIGCSVVAGLVLALAVVRGRPEAKARVEPPRPVPAPSPAPVRSAAPSYESAGSEVPDWRREAEESPAPAPWRQAAEAEAEPDEAPAPAPPPRRRYGKPAAAVDLTEEVPAVGKADLPIADYDTLRATEIINRLEGLDAAQLEALRAHEAAGKGRTSVIARIDARLESVQAPGWQVEEADWEAPEAEAEAADEELEEEEAEPEAEPEMIVEEELVEAVAVQEPEEAEEAEADGFPIANYDKLRVGQILPILRTLDPDELAMVREREEQGQSRVGVLDRIDSLSGAPKPAKKAPPAKKAAAPAKKAPAAKKAAPAPAKKAPAAAAKMTPMQAAIAAAKAKKGS